MRQLRAVFGKALDKSMRAFQDIKVEELYPTLTNMQKDAAKKMCKELCSNMRDNMEREFDQIVEHTKVCTQLNTLDKLIVQQSKTASGKRRPAVGPNPMEVLHEKILTLKKAKRDSLKAKLAACQKEISALEARKSDLSRQDKENSEKLIAVVERVEAVRPL